MSDAPRANTATFHVLTAGYFERGVASTVGLIRDGAVLVVVDPGHGARPGADPSTR